jgi:hypothetical protein
MMHFSVRFLLWVCLFMLTQSLLATELLLVGLLFLSVAYVMSSNKLIAMLYRTRWIALL